MNDPATMWVRDEQQVSFVKTVFDLKLHEEPIEITLNDIDQQASLSIGQNRTEMTLDEDTVEILALYMDDGVAMPMPLVWKPTLRSGRVVILDGNHRTTAALVRRGDASCPAVLVTGDSQIAQRLAIVVNTQHGRSTRNADYVAVAMRNLREANVPVAQIARMFGVSDAKVKAMTKRDAQAERIRALIPERRAKVSLHTLDLLGQLEDAHVRILGELFLDAPRADQLVAIERIREAPSARRDEIAHEIVGELREIDRQKRKVKATTSRPSSNLSYGLQRLVSVLDPTRAYFASTDQQKAIMRSNLDVVMPRLQRLWSTITTKTGAA